MFKQNIEESQNIRTVACLGGMSVIEYVKDISVIPQTSKAEYFCAAMNINRRQLLLELNGNGYILQAGAMQWMSGGVSMSSGVKGVGDYLGKLVASKVTKESAAKPEYTGTGQVMSEPTYRHIILTKVEDWGGSLVLDDGLFLACENTIKQQVKARSNISSAVFGKEGLFNLQLLGNGVAALESIVPRKEIIEINLENDVMKIDGNMAIAWSGSLDFTVEKSTKSLLGSAVSGEGLVNVYRGTGKIWLAPTLEGKISAGENSKTQGASQGQTGTKAGKKDLFKVLDVVGDVIDSLN